MSEAVSLLQQLVRIPSVNPACLSGSPTPAGAPAPGEGPLVDFLEQWLGEAGLATRRQTALPGRDNLLALVPGRRPGGLLLEAHLDTQGPAGMSHAPFSGALAEGRVWGRGACDTKAGMAAMLVALRRAAAEGPPTGALLALVVDEEYQFAGIERLVADLPPGPWRGAVVGEPTGLQVVNRHGGAVRLRCELRGRAAHSSHPEQGENAIYHALRLVEAVRGYHERLRRRPVADPQVPPSCTVTLIEGGEAINVVPEHCVVSLDRRLHPWEEPPAVQAELLALAAEAVGEAPLHCEVLLLDAPLAPRPDSALAALCLEAVREVGGPGELGGVAYGTDASNLARAGLDAVVLGPGDIQQAHAAEEWVETDQVERAAEVYYRLLTRAQEL